MGISMGGYFAPRCAAFEKRFKACVAWGAQFSVFDSWKSRIEKDFNVPLASPGEWIYWVLGVKTPEEAIKKLENFKLKGVAGKIECSFLIMHGEADAQQPMYVAHNLFNEVGSKDKTLKVFTREEGGSQHCTRDNQTIGTAYFGDWFVNRLIRGVKAG